MNIKRLSFILSIILLAIGYHIVGPYDYDCFKCGAGKTWYFVKQTDESRIVNEIRGSDCDHDWVLNSSMMGCADCFARHKIPLTHYGTVLGLSQIPDNTWQKELLSALADRRNRLKWAIPAVINGFVFDATTLDTDEKWKQWRKDFAPMFTPEYDLVAARTKAQVLSDAFTARFNDHGSSPTRKLLADLDLRKEDNKLFERTR